MDGSKVETKALPNSGPLSSSLEGQMSCPNIDKEYKHGK